MDLIYQKSLLYWTLGYRVSFCVITFLGLLPALVWSLMEITKRGLLNSNSLKFSVIFLLPFVVAVIGNSWVINSIQSCSLEKTNNDISELEQTKQGVAIIKKSQNSYAVYYDSQITNEKLIRNRLSKYGVLTCA